MGGGVCWKKVVLPKMHVCVVRNIVAWSFVTSGYTCLCCLKYCSTFLRVMMSDLKASNLQNNHRTRPQYSINNETDYEHADLICNVLYSIIPLLLSCCPTVGDRGKYFESHHISHSHVLTRQETYGPLSQSSLTKIYWKCFKYF